MKRVQLCFVAILLVLCTGTKANNLSITGVSYNDATRDLTFNIRWENGWADDTWGAGPFRNSDGVQVLIKYQQVGGPWVDLSSTIENYTSIGANVSGMCIPTFADDPSLPKRMGVRIITEAPSFGMVNYPVVQRNGITVRLPAGLPNNINIRIFGIEMVNVPRLRTTESYYLGDGDGVNSSNNAFFKNTNSSAKISYEFNNVDWKVPVNSFDDFDDSDPNYRGLLLWNSASSENNFKLFSNSPTGIPQELTSGSFPTYPTGLNIMWVMKYEISQGGYMQFLNTLSTTQQTTRTEYSPASASGTLALTTNANRFRNNIKIETPSINLSIPAIYGCDADDDNIFNEDSDGENIACNFLSYMDVAAYLDWAGMRPMTELEYERLCRGTEPTMLYQLAWGNNTANGNLVLAAANYSNEFIINPSLSFGNMNYLGSNIGGPLRNGIFASASGGRVRSGASFYGVMELSGNLTEPVAHIGNVKGRYTRLRYFGFGDGNLSGSGNANVFYFPGMSNYSSGGECINAAGTIIRGGSFLNNLADCSISARFLATGFTTRNSIGGGRGIGYFLTAY